MNKPIELLKKELWPVPIWFADIDFNNINPSSITKECIIEKSKGNGRHFSKFGQSWASNNLLDSIRDESYPELNKLANVVEEISSHIAEDFGFIKSIMKIKEVWCNFQYPNGMQTSHTHVCPLVALYYAQASENSGDLWFKPPEPMGYSNNIFSKANNNYNFQKVTHTPKPGRILFFPGWLSHHVVLNQSNEDRVSVSFDID
jgi:uncharacterized protein (TIGR02466 family)